MTKSDLVKKVSSRTGIANNICETLVDEVVYQIADAASKGETVTLRGLFTIAPKFRKAKKAQHITANQTIELGPRYVPYAKFCPAIKNALLKNKKA